jgi:hypothetical protein
MKAMRLDIKEVLGKYPDDEQEFAGETIAVYNHWIIARSGRDLLAFYEKLREDYGGYFDQIVVRQVLPEGIYVI